jgi:hypothetical protein
LYILSKSPKEFYFFLFFFFFLTERIYLLPCVRDERIECIYGSLVELQNSTIKSRINPSLLQIPYIAEDFLDRVTGSVSRLVWIIPRESLEDTIQDT